MLAAEQTRRLREAFALWDIGDGTIHARHVVDALRHLGREPSSLILSIYDDGCPDDERVCFDEFVDVFSGDACRDPFCEWADLLDACAAFDDGSGYIPLRDLIRTVDRHLQDSDRNIIDDSLVDIYRKVLDVSMFDDSGKDLTDEAMWHTFSKEFVARCKQRRHLNMDVGAMWYPRAKFAFMCEPSELGRFSGLRQDAAVPVGLVDQDATDFDLSEERLMSDSELFVPRQDSFGAGYADCHEHGTALEAGLRRGTSPRSLASDELMVDYSRFAAAFMSSL